MPGRIYNQAIFATRLSELMANSNDTIYTLGEYLHLSPSAISKYTNAEINPKQITIEKMAERYGVNPIWLMGANVDKYIEKEDEGKRIPVLGTIAAGAPILAQEHIEGYEYISSTYHADFCLRVKGDSMIGARMMDGDLVYIRKQADVENGEIAAVLIDKEEATLKRVFKVNGSIILHSENQNYQDRVFSKKDMKEVSIIGKAVAFKSEVR